MGACPLIDGIGPRVAVPEKTRYCPWVLLQFGDDAGDLMEEGGGDVEGFAAEPQG